MRSLLAKITPTVHCLYARSRKEFYYIGTHRIWGGNVKATELRPPSEHVLEHLQKKRSEVQAIHGPSMLAKRQEDYGKDLEPPDNQQLTQLREETTELNNRIQRAAACKIRISSEAALVQDYERKVAQLGSGVGPQVDVLDQLSVVLDPSKDFQQDQGVDDLHARQSLDVVEKLSKKKNELLNAVSRMKTEQLALQNEWIDCHSTLQASEQAAVEQERLVQVAQETLATLKEQHALATATMGCAQSGAAPSPLATLPASKRHSISMSRTHTSNRSSSCFMLKQAHSNGAAIGWLGAMGGREGRWPREISPTSRRALVRLSLGFSLLAWPSWGCETSWSLASRASSSRCVGGGRKRAASLPDQPKESNLHKEWRVRLLKPGQDTEDMRAVYRLQREVGGVSELMVALQPVIGQGYASYVIAEAGKEVIGCAQLGRLAIGGFFVLRCDFVVNTVLVNAAERRKGVGTALVEELQHRLPQDVPGSGEFAAWAMTDGSDAAAGSFFTSLGAERIGGLGELLWISPFAALGLVITAGALFRGDLCIFRLPGKSDAVEYSSLGRLEPWNAQDSARM
ncbi:unnamed protein product [Symbiodinium microadriaticum]|nr:unnamed protein product [Symbiodinium microadriaticum]